MGAANSNWFFVFLNLDVYKNMYGWNKLVLLFGVVKWGEELYIIIINMLADMKYACILDIQYNKTFL